MSIKSLIQIVIIIIIIIIVGGVYYKYFLDSELITEETAEQSITEETAEQSITEETPKISNEKKKLESKVNKKNTKIKKKRVTNLVKEVEYLTTDSNGNKYKIFANSGKTNQDNKNVLDLNNVKGIISSEERSNIYFVADFAEYNSSNQSSKFYENVVISYDDKQITCDNFDINMESNFAIAYSNVIITDPKSIMKAGKITLDIETKDISINPDANETRVKIVTN